MIIAQYFVEFIFYSFLGWVWESIYCTIKEKKWADRGFLFGPICPIYGSCVVGATIIFTLFPKLSSPDFPIWALFILCYIGSAIAEFGTSWVLEKRFHARWWDYSDMPLNIQGRICVPVSIAFGIAGVLIVKYLLPIMVSFRTLLSPITFEVLALVLAALFGADFAMTEVSLSQLLSEVERIHSEFNDRAQNNYEKIASAPSAIRNKVEESVEELEERINKEKQLLSSRMEASRAFIQRSNLNQKRILANIKWFGPDHDEAKDDANRELTFKSMKQALEELRSGKKADSET